MVIGGSLEVAVLLLGRVRTGMDSASFSSCLSLFSSSLVGILSFVKITKPLNELTCKDVPFTWEDRHKAAFNALRDLVTSELVLRQPQLDKPFEVEVDPSGFALGGVLLQRQEDGRKHPVGYYSATLNEAQQNYDIYKLELLAIAECLKHW